MKNCDDILTTEDIVFNSCNSNFYENGEKLNKILENLYNISSKTSNSDFFIIADRQSISINQVSIITGYNSLIFNWYINDILQTGNTSNILVTDKQCKVYAENGNIRSNVLFIETKEVSASCNLLINILNIIE